MGSVRLPPGRPVGSFVDSEQPVAWVTDEPVADPGRLWLALSDIAASTGLQPLLLTEDELPTGYSRQDLLEETFHYPADPGEVDALDAGEILKDLWRENSDSAILRDERLPFAAQFPGLAPATAGALSREEIHAALDRFEAAPLCLVPAGRPADTLTAIGWGPTDYFQGPMPFSAVLRSWEDRFGARLVQAGPSAELRLLAERPPRTMAEALPIAAEHWAFCTGWIDDRRGDRVDVTDVRGIAPLLLDNPLWAFWWD